MFVLSSISSGLEFWPVYHISTYENSELTAFNNIKLLGEISSNWPSNLLGANVSRILLIILSNITVD